MNAVPKLNPVRDRKYLDWLREQPCILTGWRATEDNAVDPIHIGTLGKGIKSSDDEALPMRHEFHVRGHNEGEVSMFRKHMPDWLIREALRSYAREQYREYLTSREGATAPAVESADRTSHADDIASRRLSASTPNPCPQTQQK